MRKRFPISVHLEFVDALAAKKAAKAENPEKAYQIRKFKNGFRLVERLSTSEAEVINEMRSGLGKRKRRGRAVL